MRGHIRKRGESSWQITYEIGRDENDKRIQRTETVRGLKRDADKRLRDILKSLDNQSYIEPTKVSVADYLCLWLEQKRHGLKSTTYEGYQIIIEKHLIPGLGSIPLQRLDGMSIDRYYSDKREAGLSEQTLLHHHRVFAKALKDAFRKRLVGRVATDEADSPKLKDHQKRKMTIIVLDQVPTLIDLFEGIFREMVLVSVTTGLRRSELCGLLWDVVDLDKKILQVDKVLEQTKGRVELRDSTKTASSTRSIALSDVTIDAFRRTWVAQAKDKLAAGSAYEDRRFVFANALGTPISPDYYSKIFHQQTKSHTEFSKLNVHGLRHCHASHLVNGRFTVMLPDGTVEIRPIPLKLVSSRLGHSTIKITLDLYSHLMEGQDKDAALAIDQMYAAANSE